MKAVFVLCVLAAVAYARPDGTYTDQYDNINLKEILDNKKILENYLKCLLDQGKCTPPGKELKSHIKEALENYCGKCTDAQKDGTRTVIRHLINKEPGYWQQLSEKYDPKRVYVTKYEAELKTVS